MHYQGTQHTLTIYLAALMSASIPNRMQVENMEGESKKTERIKPQSQRQTNATSFPNRLTFCDWVQ